jgi:anti-anti-sigma factor
MTNTALGHVQVRHEDGVLVLSITDARIEGEEIAEALRQEMLAAVEAAGARKLVVNFQHTRYISSAGFRPLLALRRRLNEMNGRLIVCGLSPVVGDVFYTTRMASPDGSAAAVFEMEPTVAAAVARLNTAEAEHAAP